MPRLWWLFGCGASAFCDVYYNMQKQIPHSAPHKLVFAKDPIHQLENVIMALEDAKLFHKDIYTLNVNFTSAFNTTDHDRMLRIMYDLGPDWCHRCCQKSLWECHHPSQASFRGLHRSNTSRERHDPGRDPLPISFPSLYGTPPAMAACRRTRLRPHLHPQRKRASHASGQQHQQRLLCRQPPLPHG